MDIAPLTRAGRLLPDHDGPVDRPRTEDLGPAHRRPPGPESIRAHRRCVGVLDRHRHVHVLAHPHRVRAGPPCERLRIRHVHHSTRASYSSPSPLGTFFTIAPYLPPSSTLRDARRRPPSASVVFAVTMLFFATEHRALWEAFVVAQFQADSGSASPFPPMPTFDVQALSHLQNREMPWASPRFSKASGSPLRSLLAKVAVLLTYTTHGQIYPTYQGFRVTLLIASALCMTTAVLSFFAAREDLWPTIGTDQGGRTTDGGRSGSRRCQPHAGR